jgi:hypothetical protein
MQTPAASLPFAPAPIPRRWALAVLAAWVAAALAFAFSGVLPRLPPLLIPALIWTPVLSGVLAYRASAPVRAFVHGLDPRWPILFHLVRVGFGAAFLVLLGRGALPSAFALPAGYGDLVAGTLALPALWAASRLTPRRRALVLGWNVIGLVDILMVFVSAQRLILFAGDRQLLSEFARFPFSLLPVLVVPLVLLTHFAVFARLAHGRRDG